MATRREEELERRARKCARLLVEFVNAKTEEEALHGIRKGARDKLGFDIFVGPANKRLKDGIRKHIQEDQARLKQLFTEFQNSSNLCKSKPLDHYLACYNICVTHFVHINEDGILIETPSLSDNPDHDAIIAFCVVTCLKTDVFSSKKEAKVLGLIHKCEENAKCGRYYVWKTLTEQRFCSDKCKAHWVYLDKKKQEEEKQSESQIASPKYPQKHNINKK